VNRILNWFIGFGIMAIVIFTLATIFKDDSRIVKLNEPTTTTTLETHVEVKPPLGP
jgi:hypothetical protein